jgi:acyl-CoA synthetase (AMP-forming)/AMP-acid ligase II
VNTIEKIPFLPIEFFKTHKIITGEQKEEIVFSSSGTTGPAQSRHYVTDVSIYQTSFRKGLELFYGDMKDHAIFALLPSYLEREGSSLIYMVNDMIKHSAAGSDFYLDQSEQLTGTLLANEEAGRKNLLLGVSYALLDLAEKLDLNLKNTIVMETGGMKGRRKEMVREELHEILCRSFGVSEIHSEYGMTELLSQAYSKGKGIFQSPPWMRVLIRDTEDPFHFLENGRTGGINVIDLANINSCCFIATQDLGRMHADGSFEVLGRFDNSDVRGCNLLVE